MTLDNRLNEIQSLQNELRQMKMNFAGQGGGGGDNGAALALRVSKLEGELTAFRLESGKSFGEVKVTLASLDERSKHLPTRWDTFLMISTVVGFVGGAIGLMLRFIP